MPEVTDLTIQGAYAALVTNEDRNQQIVADIIIQSARAGRPAGRSFLRGGNQLTLRSRTIPLPARLPFLGATESCSANSCVLYNDESDVVGLWHALGESLNCLQELVLKYVTSRGGLLPN